MRMREMFRIRRLTKLISDSEDELIEDGPEGKHHADVYVDLILQDMVKKYGYDRRTATKIYQTAVKEGYVQHIQYSGMMGNDLSTCHATTDKGYRLISGLGGFINELVNTYSGLTTVLLSSLATAIILAIFGFMSGFLKVLADWIVGLF